MALTNAGFYLPIKTCKAMNYDYLIKCLQREYFVITKSVLKPIPKTLNWPARRPKKAKI